MSDPQSNGVPAGWEIVPDAPAASPAMPSVNTGTIPQVAGGAAALAPIAARGVAALANSTTLPARAAVVGRVIGGLAPLIANPLNPMSYLAIPGGAWGGGKAGWFGGKMIQGGAQAATNAVDAAKAAWNANLSNPPLSGVSAGMGAISAEGAALQRLNSAISARIAELRSQGKSYGEAARQAYNETVNR